MIKKEEVIKTSLGSLLIVFIIISLGLLISAATIEDETDIIVITTADPGELYCDDTTSSDISYWRNTSGNVELWQMDRSDSRECFKSSMDFDFRTGEDEYCCPNNYRCMPTGDFDTSGNMIYGCVVNTIRTCSDISDQPTCEGDTSTIAINEINDYYFELLGIVEYCHGLRDTPDEEDICSATFNITDCNCVWDAGACKALDDTYQHIENFSEPWCDGGGKSSDIPKTKCKWSVLSETDLCGSEGVIRTDLQAEAVVGFDLSLGCVDKTVDVPCEDKILLNFFSPIHLVISLFLIFGIYGFLINHKKRK